jgi:parallel beta-helix repeat protein
MWARLFRTDSIESILTMKSSRLRWLLVFAIPLFCLSVLGQGSLTPPGAPAPTMKSLDDVDAHLGQVGENRTSLNQTNTPGNANYEFVISNAGSYYLTGNLDVAKPNGIHIAASGVTLDLNGFQIDRASGAGGNGIFIDDGANDCVIMNGTITGFMAGINSSSIPLGGAFLRLVVSSCSGVGLGGGTGYRVDGCRTHNTGVGIQVWNGSTLSNCSADNTSSGGGILASNGCALTNCTAFYNHTRGISVGDGCSLTNCSAYNNSLGGIYTSYGSTAKNCSASYNGLFGIACGNGGSIIGCTCYSNYSGIDSQDDCVISSNTCVSNTTYGVYFAHNCLISSNNSSGNGSLGLWTDGQINRIDSNTATNNGGVGIQWVNDFVVRNTSFVNTGGNYNPAVGTGNTGPLSAASSTTSPWANF